jgi:hypothetical protein
MNLHDDLELSQDQLNAAAGGGLLDDAAAVIKAGYNAVADYVNAPVRKVFGDGAHIIPNI